MLEKVEEASQSNCPDQPGNAKTVKLPPRLVYWQNSVYSLAVPGWPLRVAPQAVSPVPAHPPPTPEQTPMYRLPLYMHISPKTVSNCHYQIKKKLGVATDIELVRLALRLDVVDLLELSKAD
jgi:hypothetical protein